MSLPVRNKFCETVESASGIVEDLYHAHCVSERRFAGYVNSVSQDYLQAIEAIAETLDSVIRLETPAEQVVPQRVLRQELTGYLRALNSERISETPSNQLLSEIRACLFKIFYVQDLALSKEANESKLGSLAEIDCNSINPNLVSAVKIIIFSAIKTLSQGYLVKDPVNQTLMVNHPLERVFAILNYLNEPCLIENIFKSCFFSKQVDNFQAAQSLRCFAGFESLPNSIDDVFAGTAEEFDEYTVREEDGEVDDQTKKIHLEIFRNSLLCISRLGERLVPGENFQTILARILSEGERPYDLVLTLRAAANTVFDSTNSDTLNTLFDQFLEIVKDPYTTLLSDHVTENNLDEDLAKIFFSNLAFEALNNFQVFTETQIEQLIDMLFDNKESDSMHAAALLISYADRAPDQKSYLGFLNKQINNRARSADEPLAIVSKSIALLSRLQQSSMINEAIISLADWLKSNPKTLDANDKDRLLQNLNLLAHSKNVSDIGDDEIESVISSLKQDCKSGSLRKREKSYRRIALLNNDDAINILVDSLFLEVQRPISDDQESLLNELVASISSFGSNSVQCLLEKISSLCDNFATNPMNIQKALVRYIECIFCIISSRRVLDNDFYNKYLTSSPIIEPHSRKPLDDLILRAYRGFCPNLSNEEIALVLEKLFDLFNKLPESIQSILTLQFHQHWDEFVNDIYTVITNKKLEFSSTIAKQLANKLPGLAMVL